MITAEQAHKQEVLEDFWLNAHEITQPILDLFFAVVKQIHASGKKNIQKYLVKPLREYFPRPDQESMESLKQNLALHKKIKSYKKLGYIYKKLITLTAWEPHPKSLLTQLSAFLLDLETYPELRQSAFAKEFLEAIRQPFFEFHQNHFEHIDTTFEKTLANSIDKIQAGIITKKEASDSLKKKLAQEAEELYHKIEQAYVMGNRQRLTYLLAQYTGRFANYPDSPYREEIDKITEGLATKDPSVYQEIKERLAVKIYQSIVNALKNQDIQTALRGIATFALTFQGESKVPYRKELDVLEEKLYRFIADHNLWDKLKK